MKPLGSWDWVGAKRGDSGTLGQSRQTQTQVPSCSLPIGLWTREWEHAPTVLRVAVKQTAAEHADTFFARCVCAAKRCGCLALDSWRTLGNPGKKKHQDQPNQGTPAQWPAQLKLSTQRCITRVRMSERSVGPLPLLLHLKLISGVICSRRARSMVASSRDETKTRPLLCGLGTFRIEHLLVVICNAIGLRARAIRNKLSLHCIKMMQAGQRDPRNNPHLSMLHPRSLSRALSSRNDSDGE